MSLVAESVTQVAEGWPAAITTVCLMVGGWITVWIKQRGNGKTLGQVKDQVTNGHETNLRDDVTKGLALMQFAVDHVRQLPTSADFNKLDAKLTRLGRSLNDERAARRRLEAEFRSHYPPEDGSGATR